MIKISALQKIAAKANIQILMFDLPETGSMSIQTDQKRCYIGMDCSTLQTEATHRVHLAHELGHCVTGSFYNRWALQDVRQKHEHRADKWAIEHTIPEQELNEAVRNGHTDVWDLAEHFGVTEDFIRKAICWYKYGTLETAFYF